MEGGLSINFVPSSYAIYSDDTNINSTVQQPESLECRVEKVVNEAELYLKQTKDEADKEEWWINLSIAKNYLPTLLEMKRRRESQYQQPGQIRRIDAIKEQEVFEKKIADETNRVADQIAQVKRRCEAIRRKNPVSSNNCSQKALNWIDAPYALTVDTRLTNNSRLAKKRKVKREVKHFPLAFKKIIEIYESLINKDLNVNKLNIESSLTICAEFFKELKQKPQKLPQAFISSLYRKLQGSKRLEEIKRNRCKPNPLFPCENAIGERELQFKYWPKFAILRAFTRYAAVEDKAWLDQETVFFSKNYLSDGSEDKPDFYFMLIAPLTSFIDYLINHPASYHPSNTPILNLLPLLINTFEVRRESTDSIYHHLAEIACEVSNHLFELDKSNFVEYINIIFEPGNNLNTARLDYTEEDAYTSAKIYKLAFKPGVEFSSSSYVVAGYNFLRCRQYQDALNAFNQALANKKQLDSQIEEQEEPEDFLAFGAPIPFWTYLMLSLTHYHLKSGTTAQQHLNEYLKVVPLSFQSFDHTQFIKEYEQQLIVLKKIKEDLEDEEFFLKPLIINLNDYGCIDLEDENT